jgi:hypothetical protein
MPLCFTRPSRMFEVPQELYLHHNETSNQLISDLSRCLEIPTMIEEELMQL